MFKCENKTCSLPKHQVPVNQPRHQVTTEKRTKYYEKNLYNRRGQVRDVITVEGSEIITEIAVCPVCYENLTGQKPKIFESKPPPSKRPFRPRQKWRDIKREKSQGQTKHKVVVEQVKNVARKLN